MVATRKDSKDPNKFYTVNFKLLGKEYKTDPKQVSVWPLDDEHYIACCEDNTLKTFKSTDKRFVAESKSNPPSMQHAKFLHVPGKGMFAFGGKHQHVTQLFDPMTLKPQILSDAMEMSQFTHLDLLTPNILIGRRYNTNELVLFDVETLNPIMEKNKVKTFAIKATTQWLMAGSFLVKICLDRKSNNSRIKMFEYKEGRLVQQGNDIAILDFAKGLPRTVHHVQALPKCEFLLFSMCIEVRNQKYWRAYILDLKTQKLKTFHGIKSLFKVPKESGFILIPDDETKQIQLFLWPSQKLFSLKELKLRFSAIANLGFSAERLALINEQEGVVATYTETQLRFHHAQVIFPPPKQIIAELKSEEYDYEGDEPASEPLLGERPSRCIAF